MPAPGQADADVIIVGASFAGLAAARTAASRGLHVVVIDSKSEPGARVRTTGILVREAIEEIDIPSRLTRRVPGVRLYTPSLASIDLFSPGYAFYTTHTADLLRWMASEAVAAGAEIRFGVRFTGAELVAGPSSGPSRHLLRLSGSGLTGRYLIGADGARSAVARCFGLDRNRRFLTGLEIDLEPSEAVDPRFLHCFIDSRLAPGYIGWAAPGPEVLHVGLAVRPGEKPDLAAFLARTEAAFGWSRQRIVGRRAGLIPAGGLLRRTTLPGVLLVGDAAGWVSPMTGGGIRLAFRYGRRAGSLIADHLLSGGPEPGALLAREVPAFRAKRLMRAALDLAPPNPLIDLALATAPARRLAERIYFHRRNRRGVDWASYQRWLEGEAAAGAAKSAPIAAED